MRLALPFLFVFATGLWAAPLQLPLKETVVRADLSANRKEQKALAEQGLKLAEQCLQHDAMGVVRVERSAKDAPPDLSERGFTPRERMDAACYYYRAQAKGILQGNSFWRYTDVVRSMLADWERAKELDPNFDHGGPDRMIAEVYIALPRFFGPKDLRQNLPKAIQHLERALEISDYPTNGLDLAEALEKSGKTEEAKRQLATVQNNLSQWRQDPYYPRWLNVIPVKTGIQ